MSNNIVSEYISSHNEYIKKYGDKTVVLMQVGSFFEMYMTNNAGPNLKEISQMLNIVCTKKDKSVLEVSIKNPYMLGFPLVASDKFITILIQNGYTVALIEQVTPPPEPKRKCTNVFSPSTFISSTPNVDTNYAVCLYLEYESQKLKKQTQINPLLCVGLSAVDVTTGKVIVEEALSTVLDNELALDLTSKFILNYSPREIFIVKNGEGKMDIETIIEYLQLDMRICKIKRFDSKYNKISFQEEFLSNVYKNNKTNVSFIELLDINTKIYGTTSFVMLLDYLHDYSTNIINSLSMPTHNVENNNLLLGNNAVYQLSVLSHDDSMYMSNTKYKSLYDIVCNASTPMGKRYIKYILSNPLKNSQQINNILQHVSYMLEKNNYKQFQEKLNIMCDVEKLKRKCILNILQPYELADFIDTFEYVESIMGCIKNTPLATIAFTKEQMINLISFNKYAKTIFNLNELKKNLLKDIKTNFFNKNINKEIDSLVSQFNVEYDMLLEVKNKFDLILHNIKHTKSTKKTKNNKAKELDTTGITINNTKTEGYYLQMSALRFKSIELYLKKHNSSDEEAEISSSDESSDDEKSDNNKKDNNKKDNINIDLSNFEIKTLKSVTKLFVKNNKNNKNNKEVDIAEIQEELIKMVEKVYLQELTNMCTKYDKLFDNIISFITYIDYVMSNAITADKFGYTKPKIINNNDNNSYVKAENLRHPIVERLIDYEYIPHSIELGKNLKGMLIYGLNSSGKSVLMKAVGLSVIMAQCAMYVPAKSFELKPYSSIYTRITGNDNLFKGLSSFTLEMVELNAIIKRADSSSLVIGDEVCRGTEHISGNAIVASTIVSLSQSSASFIFATHLHELIHLECIKNLDYVKSYHLSVDFDPKTDSLIYDRKLKEGSGDKVYGILVAKYIIQNKSFIDLTLKIKNELTHTFDTMISGKTSRYNSEKYVYKCELCEKNTIKGDILPLETHHINFQKDCTEGNNSKVVKKDKEHILKNSKANLIVICDDCHNKIHSGELKITHTVMTSKGKKYL
jgi:DNA mismatch repair protein MutS